MSFKLTDEQIEAAVSWWTNALRGPKHIMMTDGERRNADRGSVMAEMLLNTFASDFKPDNDAIDLFTERLIMLLSGEFPSEYSCRLDVDYHPSGILLDAARGVIDTNFAFPIKTMMCFRDGGVQVASGYGEPLQEILLPT